MFLKTLQLHTFKDACKNHVPLCCITKHGIKRLTIGETYLEFDCQNNYRDLNDLNSHTASWIHITLEVLTLGYKPLFWYMSIILHDALCLYSSLTFFKCYAHTLLHTFLQPYGRRVTTTALRMQAHFLAYEWMKGELKKLRLHRIAGILPVFTLAA